MPCYTRTVTNANIEKWNETRAKEAISKTRWARIAAFRNGKLTVRANSPGELELAQKEITRKFSELTLREAAKRFGWQVAKTETTQTGLTQLHLRR